MDRRRVFAARARNEEAQEQLEMLQEFLLKHGDIFKEV